MFKPNCGRKLESVVWEYFVYDAASDKSRCQVSTQDCGDEDAVKHECGKLLNGKNATNLTNHLRCVHKDVFNAMEQKKKLQKQPADKVAGVQTKLILKVNKNIIVFYWYIYEFPTQNGRYKRVRYMMYLWNEYFLIIYKALVKSQLEYATTVWCTYRNEDNLQIEKVQMKATKLVLQFLNILPPGKI